MDRAVKKWRGHILFHSNPGGVRNTSGQWQQGRDLSQILNSPKSITKNVPELRGHITLSHSRKEDNPLILPTGLQKPIQEAFISNKQATDFPSFP